MYYIQCVLKHTGKELEFLCKTDKKLAMKRVALKPKQQADIPTSDLAASTEDPSPTPSSSVAMTTQHTAEDDQNS